MVGAWSKARVHGVECMGPSRLAPEMFLRELGESSTAALSIRLARSAEKVLSLDTHTGFLI